MVLRSLNLFELNPRYKFSSREIARHKCIDCGVNVIEIGDYCMLTPKIWNDKFHLKWTDNLCIKCIEARLGRRLRPGLLDLCSLPFVEGFPASAILINRLGFDKLSERQGPKSKRRRRKRRLAN